MSGSSSRLFLPAAGQGRISRPPYSDIVIRRIIPMFYLSRHFPPHDSATRFVSGKYRNKIIL